MRVEHWTNAAEQGAAAATNLLAAAPGDEPTPYAPVPFFWSDQYDGRIQFLGRAGDGDEVEIVHGSLDERRFVALFGRDGRLCGALGGRLPKLLMPYRLLARRHSVGRGARLRRAARKLSVTTWQPRLHVAIDSQSVPCAA